MSFVLSFVNFFGRVYLLWGSAGRRAKGSLQRAATARTADRKTGHNVRRHDLRRSNASMIKQKKKKNCALRRSGSPPIRGIARRDNAPFSAGETARPDASRLQPPSCLSAAFRCPVLPCDNPALRPATGIGTLFFRDFPLDDREGSR